MSTEPRSVSQLAGGTLSLHPSTNFVETPAVQDLRDRALGYLRTGYPVHFRGPAGSGKTTLAFHVAAQLGRPVVFLTGDEENPGLPTSESRRDIVEAARQSDIALSFEPAFDPATILLGRRGLSTWSLDVSATGGHSAFVLRPRSGAGAIYETSRILDRFRAAFSSGNVTVNPGLFLGGTDVSYDTAKSAGTSAGKYNVVSRSATVKGDLRALDAPEREAAKTRMREIVAANLPKASAKLEFDDLVPPFPVTDGNRSVMKIVDAAGRALGEPALTERDPVMGGFGDVNFVCAFLSAADGLGVRGNGLHAPDESIDLTSIGPATTRAAIVIARLLHPPK